MGACPTRALASYQLRYGISREHLVVADDATAAAAAATAAAAAAASQQEQTQAQLPGIETVLAELPGIAQEQESGGQGLIVRLPDATQDHHAALLDG